MKRKFKTKIVTAIILQFVLVLGVVNFPLFADSLKDVSVSDEIGDGIMFQSAAEGRILYMNEDGKYGYTDYLGKVVIEAQYDEAHDFASGIAKVAIGDEVTYIDKSGKTLFKPEDIELPADVDLDELYIYDFNDGLARVESYDYIGYIDTTGHFVIPFGTYYDGSDFMNGIAFVHDENYDTFAITTDGTVAFEGDPELEYYSFSNDRAVVYDYDSNQYGYVDKKGNLVIPFTLDDAFDFQGNLALFEENGKYGVIDNTGKIIVKTVFQDAEIIDNTYILLFDGIYTRIVDEKLNPVGKFLGNHVSFTYGHVLAEYGDGDYVIRDFSGREVMRSLELNYLGDNLMFEDGQLWDFSKVKASANPSMKFNLYADYSYQFMDNTGKVVYDLKDYDNVNPFSEGLAVVEKDGKFGYINTDGVLAIPMRFDSAASFEGGKASVTMSGDYFSIDSTGMRLEDDWSYDYDEDTDDSDYYVISSNDYRQGVADKTTDKVILKPEYDYVDDLGEGLFQVTTDYKYGLFNANNQKIIEPQYEDMYVYNEYKVAVVETGDYLYKLIDFDGAVIMDDCDYIGLIEDGLFEFDKDGKTGLADSKGNVVIKPEYDSIYAYDTVDQVLVLELTNGELYYTALYDIKNKKMINSSIDGYPVEVTDGHIAIYENDGKSSIFSLGGSLILESDSDYITSSGDYYKFYNSEGYYFIMDAKGNEYLNNSGFENVYLPVDSDRVIYTQNGKYGIATLEGDIVVEAAYTNAASLRDGVMAVYENGDFGYINVYGKHILPLGTVDYLYQFSDGYGLIIREINK